MNIETPFSKHLTVASVVLLFAGCASHAEKYDPNINRATKPAQQTTNMQPKAATPSLPQRQSVGAYRATTISGDYANYRSLKQFIDFMVEQHGFEREYLYGLFSQAKRKQWTLDYLAKSDRHRGGSPSKGSWSRYRAKFLDSRHINSGVKFWQQHQGTLRRASQSYGVPAEYILGIMAVETTFGSYVGSHRIIDALTTLAFDYQRRGEYFRGELENYLIMARDEKIDPAKPIGSYAGAMGLGQFMPSSFLEWAVDFDGDGKRDLWDPEDSIGSVANYFARHGWQHGQPVVSPVRGNLAAVEHFEPGLDKLYSLSTLQQAGLSPITPCQCDSSLRLLMLRHEHKDEYLVGYPNFYVITRYNQSTHYAMAVHELAQAIKRAYRAEIDRQATSG
ncbi:lytic murein transglycosylase B [Methylomonas sp. MgM2]